MDNHSPDAEAKMRQNLGLTNESNSQAADDRQRLARQAIRSQATAREYAERHLARAERTVGDLNAKLHAARRERTIAIAAIGGARAAQGEAEHGRRAAEAALITERATRESAQKDAREARAMVQDLRTKLALAKETIESLQVQVAPAVEPGPPTAEGQPIKRKRGRPPGKRDLSVPPKALWKADDAGQKPVQWWKARR